MQNQKKIMNAVQDYNEKRKNGDFIDYLLSLDLINPKQKMKDPLLSIFRFWESWIIKNHLNSKIIHKKIKIHFKIRKENGGGSNYHAGPTAMNFLLTDQSTFSEYI